MHGQHRLNQILHDVEHALPGCRIWQPAMARAEIIQGMRWVRRLGQYTVNGRMRKDELE